MYSETFDMLSRSLIGIPTRRDVLRGLAGLGIGLTTIHFPDSADAKKKNRKRNKPKKNEFGCLDVGKKCNGKNSKCCSGVCKGKRPKQGKKDKSNCVAHNVQGCEADQDVCLELATPCGTAGACFRTTGRASFCGTGDGQCTVCKRDSDCEASFGPGTACVVCASDCASTGATACIPAAVG